MRIAFVHSFYSSREPSGENHIVETQVSTLRRAGYDVALFSARTDDLDEESFYTAQAGLRVASGRGRTPMRSLRTFRPDVVHVHNLFPNFSRKWVKELDVPLLATVHNYRPLCANGLLLRDGHICTLCPDGRRWSGLRYRCYRGSLTATFPLVLAARKGPAADPVLSRATRILVGSQWALDIYARAGTPRDKLLLSPNFLPDVNGHGDGEAERARREGAAWLCASRISSEKGVPQLVKLWPANKRLRIAGSGPDEGLARRLAAGKQIQFLGHLPNPAIIREMEQAFGHVFPSMALEVHPFVYLEALRAGLPTLCFTTTGLAKLVEAEGTGIAARWDDALPGVLQTSEGLFPTLRQRCRAVFEHSYSERVFLDRCEEIYGRTVRPPSV